MSALTNKHPGVIALKNTEDLFFKTYIPYISGINLKDAKAEINKIFNTYITKDEYCEDNKILINEKDQNLLKSNLFEAMDHYTKKSSYSDLFKEIANIFLSILRKDTYKTKRMEYTKEIKFYMEDLKTTIQPTSEESV